MIPATVPWTTTCPILLATGQVSAGGDAMPQVRDPARAAVHGDASALLAHTQSTIARSLAEVLQGMQPSVDQLAGLREDIASLVLVSANMKLAAAGVSLLNLTITELDCTQP